MSSAPSEKKTLERSIVGRADARRERKVNCNPDIRKMGNGTNGLQYPYHSRGSQRARVGETSTAAGRRKDRPARKRKTAIGGDSYSVTSQKRAGEENAALSTADG